MDEKKRSVGRPRKVDEDPKGMTPRSMVISVMRRSRGSYYPGDDFDERELQALTELIKNASK